jgi:hypothetical protein
MNMQKILRFQGVFYLLTGLWPAVHMPSFLAVTGMKTDLWLVNTLGLILAVSGLGFLIGSKEDSKALMFIAAAQAAVLAMVDIVYNARNVLPPIYLADAAVEFLLLGCWAAVFWFQTELNQSASHRTSASTSF